jgi:hypothetical protein
VYLTCVPYIITKVPKLEPSTYQVVAEIARAGLGAYGIYRGVRGIMASSRKRAFAGSSYGSSKKHRSSRRGRFIPRGGINSVSSFQATPSRELKNIDYSNSSYNPGNDVSNFVCVNPITAGTGVTQIAGRTCVLKSVLFNYVIGASISTAAITAAAPATIVRVMLVYDKAPTGTAPLVTDVLTSNTPTAPLNLTNANRFIVLFDDRHNMGSATVNSGGTASVSTGGTMTSNKSCYKKINLPFRGPSTAGLTGIEEGAIYLYAVSTAGDAADFNVVQAYVRVRFSDA